MHNHFQRILIVRNDRLGDLVLTLPALEAARQAWPAAHLAVLASSYAAELLAGNPHVDEVIVDDPQDYAWQLAGKLRRHKFDAALVINTNTRNCLAVWLARISTRVCWAGKPVGWLTANHRLHLRRSHPPIHEAEFSLAFPRLLGATAALADCQPRLLVQPDARLQMARRIQHDLGAAGPLFGVHPGNKQSAYNWSPARYRELIERLSAYGRVMITGSGPETTLLAAIVRELPSAALPRVAVYFDLSMPELTAALSLQDVLTVSSTGPMHMAAVVGTPVVALFSKHPAHSALKWSPLGQGHTLLAAPLEPGEDPHIPREQGTQYMQRISVDQVVAANLRTIDRAGKERRKTAG